MKKSVSFGISLSLSILLLGAGTSRVQSNNGPDRTRQPASSIGAYARLPLSFEANRGQTDSRVNFITRGPGYNLFLTSTDAVFAMAKLDGENGQKHK
jgi:hypothetical protein